MAKTDFKTIDEYIQTFPEDVRIMLYEIRDIIRKSVPPETQETISYQIPTFKLNGNLVHFAAFKNHIGFYPGASGVAEFENEFNKRGYKWAKGSVQFPMAHKLPEELISRIVLYRVRQNLLKTKNK